MSDDSDLLIAAAATAALVTWAGTLRRRRPGARLKRNWSKLGASVAAGCRRIWRETPVSIFVTAVLDALRRKK